MSQTLSMSARARLRSEAITTALAELKELSAAIRMNAIAFDQNLQRVSSSEAIDGMRRLLSSIR